MIPDWEIILSQQQWVCKKYIQCKYTMNNNNIYNKTVERSELSLSGRGERVII